MRYEVYADKSGAYRWRLKAANGQTVASSGEAFASKQNAVRAVRNFVAKAAKWTYEIYADKSGKYRWRAISRNRQTVGSGGEAFSSEKAARTAAENVKKKGSQAKPAA